jgi:cell division protein FtsQ
MKKLKNILPWITIMLYIAVMLPLIGAKTYNVKCSKVIIDIPNVSDNFFIEKNDILTLLHDKGVKLTGENIGDINEDKLEKLLLMHPSIKNVNIYSTIQGVIKIHINQRTPVLRIINNKNESFYIDEQGKIMPLSTKYSANVLIASGNINLNFTKLLAKQKKLINNNDDTVKTDIILHNLNKMASFIYNNKFWKSQIEQIYVKKNGEYILIPRIGSQKIEFGNIKNYKIKFRNLKALYEQGLPKAGWNKYKTINLKYENQVICTKK